MRGHDCLLEISAFDAVVDATIAAVAAVDAVDAIIVVLAIANVADGRLEHLAERLACKWLPVTERRRAARDERDPSHPCAVRRARLSAIARHPARQSYLQLQSTQQPPNGAQPALTVSVSMYY